MMQTSIQVCVSHTFLFAWPSMHKTDDADILHTYCRPVKTLCRHDADYHIGVHDVYAQGNILHRRIPSWWREAGESGTKLLYEPEKPVVYIVPITSILGRLPLIPAGDHGTIPAALRGSKRDLFPLGKCDEDRQPGTGSKLFYISSWAMCWPTDHPKKPKT